MSLIAKFASVGSATMASRVLGFVREALMAGVLGAGPVTDAFYAAFRFPNLFRRVFAEGAFNTAFIPLFAKEMEGGGYASARQFAEDVLAVLLTILLGVSALAMIFMPFLVSTLVAPGFTHSADKFELTVSMTRIMFPYLICMSLAAMLSGILNSMRKFFIAALAPTLLNVILVALLIIAVFTGMSELTTGTLIAWGVLVSGVAQAVLLAIAVRRQDFHIKLKMPKITPDVKRLMILMAPAIVTGGITQINLMIGQIIASAQDKAIAILNFADRINQLPLGVIGVAVGVVLLPELSRALKAGNFSDADYLQNRSLEFALVLTVPAAVGLMVLPAPLVSLLYERGEFSALDTQMTATALAAFSSGLPAYVLLKIFQPGFFAREDMRTPMLYSLISVIINISLSITLFPIYGYVAIALSTSVAAWVNVILLAGTLWWRSHFRPAAATLRRSFMIVLSSIIMGGVTWALNIYLIEPFSGQSYLMWMLAILATLVLSALVYAVVVLATNGVDRNEIKASLKRRRG